MTLVASIFEQLDYEDWLRGSTESAGVAVPLILEKIPARSVVDVGCGLGAWLAVFREHGVEDLLGYDGPWVDRSRLLVTPGEFRAADLQEPLEAERRFDLAVCLEVAHLLEPEHARRLVDSLASLSDVVLFSAAIPGQGGFHHVNEQWPSYWAGLFGSRGYVATDPFRAALWEQPDVKWWFAQNIVCYATPSALERLPGLARARCGTPPLALVHPECFGRYVDEPQEQQARPPAPRHWRRSRSNERT
jgi:SAM-dependent methyltransferase